MFGSNGNSEGNTPQQGLAYVAGCGRYGINRVNSGTSRPLSFSSQHTGGAQFLLADGGVRFLSQNLDFKEDVPLDANGKQPYDPAYIVIIDSVFERLIAIDDRQPVGDF